jgi:hypothetical protein
MGLLKPLSTVRQQMMNGVDAVLRSSLLRDRRYYHDNYFGTDDPFVLAIKNLVRPERFVTKFLYGQVVRLPAAFSRATAAEHPAAVPAEWQKHAETFRRDGIVIVPGVFREPAAALAERFQLNPSRFPPSEKYSRFSIDLGDPDIFRITTDPMLLETLASYYGCQPFLRQLPGINCTHPANEKARESVGFNNYWHYDTANLTTAHILLRDCVESDSCMFYAKGSHRTHRVYLSKRDYYYSERYVRDRYEIAPCVGEAGSVVIFDPNGLHRLDLKPHTFRAHLHLNFVPGNDVVKRKADVEAVKDAPAASPRTSLTALQRRSLDRLSSVAGA